MNTPRFTNLPNESSRRVIGIACAAVLLMPAYSVAYAQQDQPPAATTTSEEAPPIPPDQLDSLVAPVALYPDSLLAQTLAASTYPLEMIQLQQWIGKNPGLKDKALADAVAKEPWDASVKSMAPFPDVVQKLSENVQWTTDLGNAFLSQQADVMTAVQRMRAKAQGTGNLKTNAQQKVETQPTEGGQQAIVIQSPSPDTVYVPSYDPSVVYGGQPTYPYPQISYPGYMPGTALSWGAGLAVGAAAWGGNWGNCDWGHGDINVNNNNNFNRNNINRQGGAWQHDPQHRGGTPYSNRQASNKYGGANRGQAGRQPGVGASNRPAGGAAGAGAGAGRGPGAGGVGAGKGPGGGKGPVGGGGGARPATKPGGGGANQIGGRGLSGGGGGGAFGGGGNGASARAASSRGGASMGGGRGGGGRGGGGGRRR